MRIECERASLLVKVVGGFCNLVEDRSKVTFLWLQSGHLVIDLSILSDLFFSPRFDELWSVVPFDRGLGWSAILIIAN